MHILNLCFAMVWGYSVMQLSNALFLVKLLNVKLKKRFITCVNHSSTIFTVQWKDHSPFDHCTHTDDDGVTTTTQHTPLQCWRQQFKFSNPKDTVFEFVGRREENLHPNGLPRPIFTRVEVPCDDNICVVPSPRLSPCKHNTIMLFTG